MEFLKIIIDKEKEKELLITSRFEGEFLKKKINFIKSNIRRQEKDYKNYKLI